MERLIYFITFFIFQGYYAGLAIMIALGLTNFSRFYSIPLRMITLVAMIFIVSKNYNSLFSRKNSSIVFLVLCFWILYFLKLIYHVNFDYSLFRSSWLEYIFYALAFCILPFLAYASIDFLKYKKIILDSLIFSGFVFGIVCLYLYKDILATGVGRISDIRYLEGNNSATETLNPLALSYGGVLTLVLCLYKLIYIQSKDRKEKLYLYITIILSLILFFLGSSRGSMIALASSGILFLFFGSYRIRVRSMIVLFLSLPILIYGAVLSGSSIFDRLENTIESGDEGRSGLWNDAWNEFSSYPILGNRIEIGFYPHNIFLEVLMSTGIVGFLLIMIILIKAYKKMWFKTKRDIDYLIPLIIANQAISQHMVTGAIYISILLFVALGIAYSSSSTHTESGRIPAG